jgi:peptide/nickel transport system substrate-binding protein
MTARISPRRTSLFRSSAQGIINTPGGFTIFTRSITEKIIVDPYTIRLKTATPYPNLPIDMAGLIIVSSKAAKGAVAADFDSGKATIGTGPWKFVRYIKGDRIELARNDNYWGAKPPWDKVTFRLITSDPSRIAALLSGDVQMIEVVPPADYAKLKVNKDITIFTTTSNRMIHLHLDSNRDKSPFVTDKAGKPLERNPFKDARVRKAVSKAINRNAIVERVMDGLALPAGQLVPEGFFGVSATLKPEPFDPEGARKAPRRGGLSRRFRDHAARPQQPLRERRPDRAGSRADADARGHCDQGRNAAVLGLRFARQQSRVQRGAVRLGRLHRARRRTHCAR